METGDIHDGCKPYMDLKNCFYSNKIINDSTYCTVTSYIWMDNVTEPKHTRHTYSTFLNTIYIVIYIL